MSTGRAGCSGGTSGRRLRAAWKELTAVNDRISRVGLDPDERAALVCQSAELLGTVGELIRQGAHDAQTQEEVLHLLERKRRLVESQSKREVLEQHMISYEDAAVAFRELAEAVRAEVKDRVTLAAIADRFGQIVGRVEFLEHDAN